MPKANTAATELSLAFGVLGLHPLRISVDRAIELFDGTLNAVQHAMFIAEYQRDQYKYDGFYNLGLELRRSYAPFSSATRITAARWEGPIKQANTSSVARDLFIEDTSISVKDDSNLVRNPSPHNLFVALPKGEIGESDSENWYAKIAPGSYQALYAMARSIWWPELPESVCEYDKSGTRSDRDREALGRLIKEHPNREFLRAYVALCHEVATQTADLFN